MICILSNLTSAFLILTHACNLRCRYCFVKQNPEYISLQTAKDSVDFLVNGLKEHKHARIDFFGGEPMLCYDSIIVPLVKYAEDNYNNKVSFSITTNGTLLTEDRLCWLSDHKVGLLLSMDGNKLVQGYNRPFASGKSSFYCLDEVIPFILQHYPNTTFRSTVIPATVDGLFDGMLYAKNKGFKSYFCIPNSFEEWSEEAFEELRHQIHLFADYFIEECRIGNQPIAFTTFNDMFQHIKQINRAVATNQYRCSGRCKSWGSCGLCSGSACAIDTKGNIFTCQEFTSNLSTDSMFCIGNIYQGVNNDKRKQLLFLYDSEETQGYDCKNCLLNSICDGGCIANNYLITGNMRHMPKVQCQWNQLLLDEAIRVARILGGENNPTFLKMWKGM